MAPDHGPCTPDGTLEGMAEATVQPVAENLPSRSPLLVLGLSWLVPGGGHFLLGKRGRGALIFASVALSFVLGLLMRGAMFLPKSGDLLTTLIQYGGFVADLSSGLLYLLTVWLGYTQEDLAGHSHDYGAKFLVAAGLLNILAMVDAWDIATKKKD
jgi:hypothetical protein